MSSPGSWTLPRRPDRHGAPPRQQRPGCWGGGNPRRCSEASSRRSSWVRGSSLELANLITLDAPRAACSNPGMPTRLRWLAWADCTVLILGVVSAATTPTLAAPARHGQALGCPAPTSQPSGLAPWSKAFTRKPCIRGPEGRWLVEPDSTDRDGWRHFLRFTGTSGKRWTVTVTAPTGIARRRDGHVVVTDLKQGVTLISPSGAVLWRSRHPYCGAVESLAVGWDHSIYLACGYSLVRIEKNGKVAWQKWPFGNTHVGNLWVACDGSLFASSGGTVARLAADGSFRWRFGTGSNRHVGTLAWLPAGNLAFVTSMAARHSPPSRGGLRLYYPYEPPELLELTPAGKAVRRERLPAGKPRGGWPTVLGAHEDGGHRAPFPRCPRRHP